MFKTNRDLALLILRVGASGMMLVHGIPKISKLFETPIEFADPIGVGPLVSLLLTIIGEVIAPILIIVGYKTKLASIPALITMLVAAFVVHAKDLKAIGKNKLVEALNTALPNLAEVHRKHLHLVGFETVELSDYESIMALEKTAIDADYPEII